MLGRQDAIGNREESVMYAETVAMLYLLVRYGSHPGPTRRGRQPSLSVRLVLVRAMHWLRHAGQPSTLMSFPEACRFDG